MSLVDWCEPPLIARLSPASPPSAASPQALASSRKSPRGALPDYSTRIISQGGATTGTGGLNMYASTIGLVATNGVGIGTTVPSAALHLYSSTNNPTNNILRFAMPNSGIATPAAYRLVFGSDAFGPNDITGAISFIRKNAFANNAVAIAFSNYNGSSSNSDLTTESMRIDSNGFVGIGTTNPTAPLYVKYGTNADSTGGPSGTWASILYNATNLSGANGLLVKNNWRGPGSTIFECGSDLVGGAYASLFTINGVGSVGIGTAAPNSALTVAGNIAPSVTTTYTLGTSSYGWGGTYTSWVSNIADTLTFYCAPGNGTSFGNFNFVHNGSSYANLSQGRGVALQCYAGGDALGGIYFMSNASATANTAYAQINVRGFGGGSVTYLYIVPTGPTAVHATVYPGFDQTVSLGVAGYRWSAVYAVNGAIQTSDSKEKDAVPLSYGLNEILQVRTIKYKWKSQAELPDDSPEKTYQYYGFCADELAPIFPELVYNEDPKVPVQMNYSEIMPVMVNAIKEQNTTIVSLQTQVAMLEARLAALESK